MMFVSKEYALFPQRMLNPDHESRWDVGANINGLFAEVSPAL
jgi:hypothetical protein